MEIHQNGWLENKTVFIAGATGMAGSGILRYLIKNHPNTSIRASCYKTTEPFLKNDRIRYVQGDLRSAEDCRRMIKGCNGVIMAAAHTGGAGFVTRFPWEHIKENLDMNIRMLDVCKNEGVKRVLYIGSATVYQESNGKIKEADMDYNHDPEYPYTGFGWMGRFLEKMLLFFNERYGIETISVRAANIYGPYANFNPETSNFVPAIVRKAVDGIDPFKVWGTPDIARDIIYVDDFARAIVMMADNHGIASDIFNVGTGRLTTVDDVVYTALKHSGHKPSVIRYLQDKPTTIKSRVLDCTKAKDILGWETLYNADDGIRETVMWWKENREWWKK